jgi:hypothetical protein
VNPLRILLLLGLLLIPSLCLTGCATAESDADDVADEAIKGLSGQGHLYNEKVEKSSYGSLGTDFQ